MFRREPFGQRFRLGQENGAEDVRRDAGARDRLEVGLERRWLSWSRRLAAGRNRVASFSRLESASRLEEGRERRELTALTGLAVDATRPPSFSRPKAAASSSTGMGEAAYRGLKQYSPMIRAIPLEREVLKS